MKHKEKQKASQGRMTFLVAAFICFLFSTHVKAQDTSWYSDSETTFTLTTKEQLIGFRDLVNKGKTFEGKYVKLEADIVLNDFSTKSPESDDLIEWKPIGTKTCPFKGTFDGDCHSIYGIYITKGSYVGLFGYVQNGTIQNLSVKNLYINAYDYVGGIAGYCDNTTILNCINKGYITFNDDGGGICGSIAHGTITKCCNYGNIVSTYAYVDCGGIVGSASDSNITLCANYSSIESAGSSMSRTGGIVGWFYGEDKVTRYLTNCFNKGDIKGKFVCGGIIGYASGTAGYTSVSRCINYGKISATSDVGAIVAYVYDSWKLSTYQCYFLDNSCTKAGWGSPVSKTEQQLKSQDFLDSFNSNDFWKFGNDGFPTLSFINEDEPAFLELKNIFFEESVTLKLNIPTAIVPTYFPFFAEKKLRWQSANEQIATVDQDGKVTGIAPGETKIIVTDNLTNVQASCNVSVIMEVGDTFKADIESGSNNVSTTFMLTDLENRFVSVGDGTNSALSAATTGSISIPETIVGPGNLTYTVTSIGNKAFASSKISSVSIPQEIATIGDNAFNGCNNLTSVTVEWTEPLIINSTCFSNASNATLNVPRGCYETYATAENWSNFKSIIEPPHIEGDLFNASVTAGSGKTDMCFKVIDAENKYVSVGNGEEPAIADYTSGKVVIPSTVTGYDGQTYQVKQISDAAFFDCYEVTAIELPDGITSIGRVAFYDCAGLTSFTIPATVTSIDEEAFNNCYNLTSINIPSSVTSLGAAAFVGCSKLTSVTVNWSEPIAIDDECFTNAANATLNIPKGSYMNYATAENWKNFKTIKEPAHSLGDTFMASITAGGTKVDATFKVTNTTNKYVSIGDGEDSAIDIFTSGNIVIPSTVKGYDGQTYTVKKVSDAAFFGCENVSSVSLPSSITEIGNSAFLRCYNLANITIPTTVTKIGNEAFFYCEKLSSISIPKNVTSIGTKAFKNCNMLTSVTAGWNTPIEIDTECFSNAANATLYVPYGSKERYGAATGWKQFKNIVEMAPKDGDMFTALTEEGIKMTFTIISASAKTCKVGDGSNPSVPTGTNGLVTIPSSANDFAVTQIAYKAFYNCSQITGTVIPTSVTSIGSYAFSGCNNLTSVTVGWDEPISISTNCFSNAANATLYVPAGCKSTYEAADVWKTFRVIWEEDTDISTLDNVLYVESKNIFADGLNAIYLKMKNSVEVAAIEFDLELPEGMSYDTMLLTPNRVTNRTDFTPSITPITERKLHVFYYPNSSDAYFSGTDGDVARITIETAEDLAIGDYPLILRNIEISGRDGKPYTSSYVKSTLTVVDGILGDVNNSGNVSVADIVGIVNYKSGREMDNFHTERADVNGDGSISVADIVGIVNTIVRNARRQKTPSKQYQELDPQ